MISLIGWVLVEGGVFSYSSVFDGGGVSSLYTLSCYFSGSFHYNFISFIYQKKLKDQWKALVWPWFEMLGFFNEISPIFRLSEKTDTIFHTESQSTNFSPSFFFFLKFQEIIGIFVDFLGNFPIFSIVNSDQVPTPSNFLNCLHYHWAKFALINICW